MADPWEIVSTGGGAPKGEDVPAGWQIVSQEPPVDTETGAPFLQRIAASFKSNPESAANYYKTRSGVEDARVRDGEVQIKYKGKNNWVQADPKRLELGDIADLIGESPEIAGGTLGGILGATGGSVVPGAGTVAGGVAGAAGGTAAGNVLKQAVGAFIPGKDVETVAERAGNVLQSGAWGAVGEGAGRLAHQGLIKPTLQYMFREGAQSATAAEARAIESAVNAGRSGPEFRFTPGQETGSKTLRGIEAAAPDLNELRRTDQLFGLQDKAMNMVEGIRGGAPEMSKAEIGTELKNTFQTIDDLMMQSLETRANKAATALEKDVANKPVMEADGLKKRMAEIQYTDTSSTGVAGDRAKEVGKLLEELPDKMTLSDVQLYLKRWGQDGAKGVNKELNQQLYQALSSDLEAYAARTNSAGRAAPGARAASNLVEANKAYTAGLNELDAWRNGLFAKVVGDYGPESAGRIVKNLDRLSTDELKSVMTVIGTRPEVANAVKSNWLQTAMETAAAKQAQRGTTEFNPKLVLDELGFGKKGGLERAQTMLGQTHKQTMDDLLTLQKAASRMTEGNTGMASAAWDILRKVSPGVRLADFAKNLFVPKYMSRVLLNPQAREELAVVANAKSPTRRVTAALTYLIGDQALTQARQQ